MRRKFYPRGQSIEVWLNSLSMTEVTDYARKAGKQRWKNASVFEKQRAGLWLRPYNPSRSEALRRLGLAYQANARKQYEKAQNLDWVWTRPRLPR
jgi:hypothetical protein